MTLRTESGGGPAVQYDGKGWPALFLAHPDRGVMAIECKSVRGRLTTAQSDWLDRLNPAGVPAVVVRPADYDETIATITSGIRRTSRRIHLQDSRRLDDNDAE